MKALLASARVEASDLMVVGAQCRNIWSVALGSPDAVRRTHDLDLGIAVRGMAAYDELVEGLEPAGDTGSGTRWGTYESTSCPSDTTSSSRPAGSGLGGAAVSS
ncbi:MAG: hypothetical protein LH477_03705 [Nocardioides sp.]|nr:hypothetical protein [Nocardioides sp.]